MTDHEMFFRIKKHGIEIGQIALERHYFFTLTRSLAQYRQGTELADAKYHYLEESEKSQE